LFVRRHRSGCPLLGTIRIARFLPALAVTALILSACSSDGPADPNDDDDLEITDTVSVELAVDSGEVGLVIDARQIARMGYKPTTAEVAFPAHSSYDQTLPIDPVTSLAVLKLPLEDLTTAEQDAFADGVAVQLFVRDAASTLLGERQEASQVLDDSNLPLDVTTALPFIKQPLKLKPGVPYLLQPESETGVMTTFASDAYEPRDYVPASPVQQFFFTPKAGSADPDTYMVEHIAGYADGTIWTIGTDDWLHLRPGTLPEAPGGPDGFVFEQDADGWLRIRVEGTSDYLLVSDEGGGVIEASATESSRFRLISDNINWVLADRGTMFHDPIVPPAQLDFAYKATIRNCSQATLSETVGRAESRVMTSETKTSESFQVFSSDQLGVSVKVGVEVGAGVEGTAKVGGSVEETVSYNFTTSQTNTTENTISKSQSVSSEVSRTREVTLDPQEAVEVYDAVRTIRNVRIPFSQVLRITGTYDKDGSALTGPEIMTQMLFNFVGGVPATIGANYVDMSIRGHVSVDQMFEAQTDANDIPGACS